MVTFPIELDVSGNEALVAGDFPEARAKIARLVEAGAQVTVITERPAREADLDGKLVSFVHTTDGELARRLFEHARDNGLLLCTVDRPETSTFTSSAIVRAGGLTMTFSSGGASPGTAKRIREDLTALFENEKFAAWLDALRELRMTLPPGSRAKRMSDAVQGFAIEARLRFPDWFESRYPARR